MIDLGDTAPDATVKMNTQEKTNQDVNLNTIYQENKTNVFYFFPAAFTGVCTDSSCELRDDISEFEDMNTNVYGVSVDMSFSLKVFIEKNEINYPILSDWNKEMIEAFDIVDDEFAGDLKGVAKRSLFAVKNGQIIYKWVAEHPGKYPPFDELKNTLNSTN